ncbi:MAG: Eco57I restriction-modification methylase domain-containing protein [Chitinophagaceae bacterium]|nr:Eco57I restriction-modification methylase domain-containing protein [Chitinophagaceae bacterium]
MKLELIKPIKALNKAYLKEKVSRNHIELFKKNLQQLLGRINEQESEEHLKNVIADFLKDTWYKDQFEINTKDRNDLVIHTGKTTKEAVGVILEVKKPSNKAEMMTAARPNTKALQELVLYYLRERVDHNNTDIKYLVVTNIYEWFVIDEVWFEKNVFRNSKLKKDYENWKLSGKDTKFFYESIAKSFLDEVEEEMPATYFDVRTYEKYVNNTDKEDDTRLIGLYKILSPAHLLKQPFINDSNSLDTKFYVELLHIIGLEEIKDGGKKLIKRKAKSDEASLLENTIIKLEDKDALRNITNLSTFGANKEEQLFNVALELCITWVNRVLFIKLLEAQLYKYHKGNKDYLFLNSKLVFDFDELSNLFFQVLAEKPESRRSHIQEKFSKVPYLNSSLFERIELERQTINISELDNRLQLPLSNSSVLKDDKGKRKAGTLPTLQYLFEFLDAYDFTSEGGEEIQEENKNLINASVLGLIFEKINGYKDGSFFTPGFVTMYMCKETIRRSVLQKFNHTKGWQCDTIDNLYNKIEDKKEANKIINSLHICDPAVGSGHFLVSALNEMIAIKSELKILQDATGKSLRDYHVEVVNDELIISDEDGKLFDYNPQNKESQRIQETLFHEKETIIENCLFGVDINPNSVKICRLRLWIELLKNAYYTPASNYIELETLPNIDINIKCGNSLISRFTLDADIKSALRNSKWSIESYKIAVQTYRDAESKEQKREMEELIDSIKKDFRSYISPNDPKYKKLSKLRGDLFNLSQTKELFDEGNKKNKDTKKRIEQLSNEITKLETEIGEIKNNKIYENAFEWRFEFPEVLNGDGDYIVCDMVIGNPPYLTGSAFREFHNYYIQTFSTAEYQLDLYPFFIELSTNLLLSNGYVSLITPNSWLKNLKMQKTRKYVLDNLKFDSINPNISKAFEEAQVDTLIFIASKRNKNGEINIWTFDDKEPSPRHLISQGVFFENDGFVFDLEVNPMIRSIIKKVRLKSKLLEDDFEITRGVNPYDKYRGQSEDIISSKAYHSSSQKDETFKPELRGKHVSTFNYKWDNKHFISYGPWLAAPRDPKFFTGKRILFREILGNRFVTTIIDEDFILDRSLYIGKPLNDSINVEAVLGVLSSKLLIWLFRIEKNEFDDLFPKIRLEEFKKLPIPKDETSATELAEIVNQIISAKADNAGVNASLLENKLDKFVYKIYGLAEDEIKIIEQG